MLTEFQADMFRSRIEAHDRLFPGYMSDMAGLSDLLLQYGGDAVVPPPAPDLRCGVLLGRHTVRSGGDAIFQKGMPNECHRNVERLHFRGRTDDGAPVTGCETGYALSDDGLWRQHSWALSSNTVVETTTPRLVYVGCPSGG